MSFAWIKYAAIVIVVSLVAGYMNKRKDKKHDEMIKDPNVTPDSFVIRQDLGLIAILFWLGIALGAGLFVGLLLEGDGIGWVLLGLFPAVLGVWGIMYQRLWMIEVEGDDITVRNSFGKVKHFKMSDITEIKAKEINNSYSYKFYSGTTKLFSIDENTDDIYLIDRLTKEEVPIT